MLRIANLREWRWAGLPRRFFYSFGVICLFMAHALAADQNAAASKPQRGTILVLGDSLAAGYGLEPAQSFPSLLQEKIDEAGLAFEIVNSGVSGDTSAGGLRRLD